MSNDLAELLNHLADRHDRWADDLESVERAFAIRTLTELRKEIRSVAEKLRAATHPEKNLALN